MVIADDEPLARAALRTSLLAAGGVEIAAECRNGEEVAEAVERERPDAVFLDVAMPKVDGITAGSAIVAAGGPALVFVTAYDEHAVRAFELGAADYLLKPFDHPRVAAAIARIRERLARPRPADAWPERFLASSGGRIVVVAMKEIESIAAAENYVELSAAGRKSLLRRTLKSVESQLDPDLFVRVHRSHIVRLAAIDDLRPHGGDYRLRLRSGATVPMSRNYRDDVLRRLNRPR